MIFRTLFTVVLSLCIIIVPLLSASHSADGKIVVQVGSVPVTSYELGRAQQKLLPFNVSFHGGLPAEALEKIKAEALSATIDQAYKVNFAIDNNIKIEKKIIDDNIDGIKKKYKTEKEFKKALGDESLKELRVSIERTLLAQKAEEIAVTNNIRITDAEIRAFYEKNKQTYKRPKQFKASHILIKIDPSSNKDERAILEKKAEDLAKKAKTGEDFYNLAYYNSDDRSKYVGGDIGYFHEGQTLPEFEDVIKKMKVGEISGPVKSMYGWHIIKLVERNEAKQLEFDDVKVKIREQLEKKAKDNLYSNWMNGLKTKYTVKKF